MDTLDKEAPRYPGELNENGVHLNTWVSSVNAAANSNVNMLTNSNVFSNTGRVSYRYNNEGRVIRIFEHPDNPNPTFVAGDSLPMVAQTIVQGILGYDLENYSLRDVVEEDTLVDVEQTESEQEIFFQEKSEVGNTVEYNWVKKSTEVEGPETLSLKLSPALKEFKEEIGVRVEFGASIASFIASNSMEPDNLNENLLNNDNFLDFGIVQLILVLIVALFGFYSGFRAIAKGEVVWARATFTFLAIALAIWGWRAIYFASVFSDVAAEYGTLIFNFNQLLFGLAMGLFAAAVYIGWESTSRKASMQQLPVVDAIWGRRFLVREIGDGLLKGYLLGGIIIGIFSLLLFLLEERVIQADSQFVFAEPSNNPKLLTINMSAWSTVWIVSLAQVGVVYNLINNWFKKPWITYAISAIITGVMLTFVGRLIGTTAPLEIDLLIFMIVGVFVVYFYQEYGILSVATGLWLYSVLFLITPYMNSAAIDVIYVVWVQAFIIAGPFLFAFIAYKYGESVIDLEQFVPEYESRQAEVMRVEKEIEIARESQYNLMPLQPPKGEGFDVHGFFLPSFEVGGDFYDYVLAQDEDGNATSLTMTIVDVSGKAMRAAMPAVFTSGLLLSRMHADNPSEILREVTRPLYNRTDAKTFVTCILSKLDINKKLLITANAGHCYPILKRNGLAEFIETPAPRYPLGIKDEVNYTCEQTQLQDGDLVVFYSDGLPEASNDKGEWFSFEGVKEMIREIDTDALSSYEITQEIKRRIQKFSNYNLADDTTIICLKV